MSNERLSAASMSDLAPAIWEAPVQRREWVLRGLFSAFFAVVTVWFAAVSVAVAVVTVACAEVAEACAEVHAVEALSTKETESTAM